MRNRHLRLQSLLILFVFAGLVLGACAAQEPIRIYVTPTADATTIAQQPVTSVPTDTPMPQAITATSSQTPVTPTVPATPTPGDGLMLGSIIGPDYTPPPTNTPRPTVPPPTNTVVASPTPIPQTPVTTPLQTLSGLDRSQMGMQLYYNMTIDQWWQTLQLTKRTNVEWVKVQADWSWIQPDGPDQLSPTFNIFRSHVQRAYNEGFNVLVSVAKAPGWARNTLEEDGPPSDPQLLADFLSNVILEEVGDQINAIEVWNEPNIRREWNGDLSFDGAGYMQLFAPAYDAIRAFSPEIEIITAGLAPTGNNLAAGARNDRDFLREMYAAGLTQYNDVHIGVHPYGWGNPPDTRCCNPIEDRAWDDQPQFFFLETLEDYHDITQANNHDTMLWVTEFGWATWTGIPVEPPEEWMTYNTPQQQREYTLRAFEIGQDLEYVGPMFLWNLNFANPTLIENRNEMVGYSLLVPGLPRRPLFDSLVNQTQ